MVFVLHFYFTYWASSFCRFLERSRMHAINTGADPGFFSGGGAPPRNDVTDRWGKQRPRSQGTISAFSKKREDPGNEVGKYILKAFTKKKASSRGGEGRVRTPCTLSLDQPLQHALSVFYLLDEVIRILTGGPSPGFGQLVLKRSKKPWNNFVVIFIYTAINCFI